MATYLQLSNLATEPNFLARIGYAIGSFAAYIMNEASNATDHAKRLNWALRATSNVPQMAVNLMGSITHDANVVFGLDAVTDSDLQNATETAANNLIGAAISYTDLMVLVTDQNFLKRIQAAIAKFSMYILNENPSTANHSARYAWARNAVLNTAGVANALASPVVMNDVVSANLLGTTDSQLQSAVEQAIGTLLL